MGITGSLIVSLVLLAANAWFVLFEFSLVKLRPSRLRELEEQGARNARGARRMHERMNDFLGACQLGITIASLGIGWLAEPAVSAILEPYVGSAAAHGIAVTAAFAVITLAHIVFGELVPKAIAIQVPERALLLSVPAMAAFHAIFYLPLRLLNGVANLVLRALRLPADAAHENALSVEEMRIVVGDAYAQGAVSLERSLLVENALDFETTTARMVMTPIDRAAALDLTRPWADNVRVIAEMRLSRYLLLDGGIERIVGIVLLKDLGLEALLRGEIGPLDRFRREVVRVPADCSLAGVMRMMQRERSQFAVVVDGGTAIGIVTLEDVLEELVGEIHDEFEERRVWNLSDHLVRDATLVDAYFRDIPGAVRTMVEAIASADREIDVEAATRAVLRREAIASTSVGHGVALPHARLPGLGGTRIALARVEEPMAWPPGTDLVRFVFLILSPEEQPIEQVRALSRIATLVRDEALFDRLDAAPGVDAVLAVVAAADVVAA